ncbi:MAG: hypothetical protein ABIO38_07005, partial [Luteimonas sp.]
GTGGNAGNSGNSGTGGKSGNSGNSGTGGKSGNSGNTGTGGKSGNSGNSGTGGKSGNSGNSGTGGKSGNSGNSGQTGSSNNGNGGKAGKGNGFSGSNGNAGGFDFLTPQDQRMAPKDPKGAPVLPSQCMEDEECRPCFVTAQASLDKTRANLEKLRGIYEYTHRFTARGQEFMSAAGQAGGGISQMGAVAENMKVDAVLEDFDNTVRKKNNELLGRLKTSLDEIGTCEADYFNNDDWYLRYGAMYYQFMQGHYGYASPATP